MAPSIEDWIDQCVFSISDLALKGGFEEKLAARVLLKLDSGKQITLFSEGLVSITHDSFPDEVVPPFPDALPREFSVRTGGQEWLAQTDSEEPDISMISKLVEFLTEEDQVVQVIFPWNCMGQFLGDVTTYDETPEGWPTQEFGEFDEFWPEKSGWATLERVEQYAKEAGLEFEFEYETSSISRPGLWADLSISVGITDLAHGKFEMCFRNTSSRQWESVATGRTHLEVMQKMLLEAGLETTPTPPNYECAGLAFTYGGGDGLGNKYPKRGCADRPHIYCMHRAWGCLLHVRCE